LRFIATYTANGFLADKYEQGYAAVNVDISFECLLLLNDAMSRIILEQPEILG